MEEDISKEIRKRCKRGYVFVRGREVINRTAIEMKLNGR